MRRAWRKRAYSARSPSVAGAWQPTLNWCPSSSSGWTAAFSPGAPISPRRNSQSASGGYSRKYRGRNSTGRASDSSNASSGKAVSGSNGAPSRSSYRSGSRGSYPCRPVALSNQTGPTSPAFRPRAAFSARIA